MRLPGSSPPAPNFAEFDPALVRLPDAVAAAIVLPAGAEWARGVVTSAWLEHEAATADAVPKHLAVAHCMDEQCAAVRPRECHPRWESLSRTSSATVARPV